MIRDTLSNGVRPVVVASTVLALLLLISALFAAQPDPDAKINRWLINTLVNSTDGTAPFFVVFGERTPLAAAQRISDWTARGRFVVDSLEATAERSQNGVRGYLAARGIEYTPFWVVNEIYIPSGTLELARYLARRPEIAAIVPEEVYVVPPSTQSDAIQSLGWNLALIEADAVWGTYANRGRGMVVANIDTGVQFNHPALVNQYRGNLGGGSYSHTMANWYDPTATCTGGLPCDNNGHGTHTMGTMVGESGAAQIGVAPDAKWIACKGCATNTCASSALTACAQWILAPGGDPAKRPNVVNNSWGGGGGDSWYQSYVKNWVAAGVFPAFSNGNSGPNCSTSGSPGDYPESFSSGATDKYDAIAGFSSRGPSSFGVLKPDVSAPGMGIYSSVPTDGYAYYSGTSMASPHTAGTVALLWAIRPSYVGNIPATRQLLQNTAFPLITAETCGGILAGQRPNNTYGHGRINARAALEAGGVPVNSPPTVTIVTPASDGMQFPCGTPVSFAASASDSADGDLGSQIQWSGPGSSSPSTGASITRTFACDTELGDKTVTATVTDKGGLSATDTIVANIYNPATVPPAAPTNLTAVVSGRTVQLNWTASPGNQPEFKVYRRQQSGKKWLAWINITGTAATSYPDPVPTVGKYQYYVTAYKGYLESTPSNTVTANVRK